MDEIQAPKVQIPREIIQYWGSLLAFGIGVLVLGIAAVVAIVVSIMFFGWLLMLASGIEFARAGMVGLRQFSSGLAFRPRVRQDRRSHA